MFLGGPVPQVNVLHALRALGGMVVLPASGNGGEEVRVGISAAAEEALEEVKAPGAAEKLR